jgi:hypothetical protein
MPETPWVGLLALAALFVIPFLPDWLFEGPRRVKHWPRRHVCGDCGAPWTEEHDCWLEPTEVVRPAIQGELYRPGRVGRSPRAVSAPRRRPQLGPRSRRRS